MEQDTVQIDAPDFDPDTDGPDSQRVNINTAVVSVQELFTSPEPEYINASNTQEEDTDRDQSHAELPNSEDPHRSGDFPLQVVDFTPEDSPTDQQYTTSADANCSDEIPQLEEDWDNGQFDNVDASLINRHNTHSESERIRKEYTKRLLDLSDNQYYSQEYPEN